MTPADLATARREAEVWLAEHGGALWCADVELILRSLLAASPEPATIASIDLTAIPVHFVTLLPRGRIFMHPDTQTSGVRDPWPPTFTHWTGAATKPDATPEPAPALSEEVRGFVRGCRDNWDHDLDAHRDNTPCRKCEAGALIAARGGRP